MIVNEHDYNVRQGFSYLMFHLLINFQISAILPYKRMHSFVGQYCTELKI